MIKIAAHYVICKYCGKKFNRDKEPFAQVGARRYAHIECYEKNKENTTKEERDKIEFEEYVMKLLNQKYINPKVRKQVKEYIETYHYTYSGMLKSLKWFYEIEHNSIEKANGGIGIIPYIYSQAYEYYFSIFEAQQINKGKDLSKFAKPDCVVIEIESPVAGRRKIKFFDLGEGD